MREEKVTIVVNKKTGLVNFECNGFIGSGCNVISDIENAVGQVTTTTATEEAYQYEIPDPVMINI